MSPSSLDRDQVEQDQVDRNQVKQDQDDQNRIDRNQTDRNQVDQNKVDQNEHVQSTQLAVEELPAKETGLNADTDSTPQYASGLRLAVIAFSVTLCIFLVALDLTIISTAIPHITDEFHSLDQVGWYGSAFFLTVAAFQATWGKAFKYFNLKIAYLISIFIFELGSLICGVAPSSTALIAGRAVAGLGAGGLAAGGYTIIAFSAPIRLRPILIGILGVAFCISSVLGPLLGGVFTQHLSWRWCFYINLPIGGLALANIVLFFHTPAAAMPKKASLKEKLLQMDFPGTFAIMAATICYILALQWGGTSKPWHSADVIGTLVGFGLLIILLVVIEYFSEERGLLVGRILKDRTVAALSAFMFFAAGVFFVLLYYLPIYFQTTRGASAQQSGIDIIPLVLAAGLFSLLSGGLISASGHFVPIMVVGSCLSAVGAGLIYTFEIGSPSRIWIGFQILLGIGLGAVFQIPQTAAQSVVPPGDLAPVSSVILFFQTIGGAFWVSAAQAGFANRLLAALPATAPEVDPRLVLATGATQIRNVFTAEQVPGILAAYMDGLRLPFAIAISCACAASVLSVAPRWEKIKLRV